VYLTQQHRLTSNFSENREAKPLQMDNVEQTKC